MGTKKILGLAMVALIVGFTLSLMVGETFLLPADLLQILLGQGSRAQQLIFQQFRLPRSLMALLGGFGLATAGYLLQGVTRNPLADPSILGINSGAGLFVLIYLGFVSQGQAWLLPGLACLGGFLAAALVYVTAKQKNRPLSLSKLLLAGIAVNAGISALTLLINLKLSAESYKFVAAWLAGSIWGSTWSDVGSLFPLLLILAGSAFWRMPILQLVSLGETAAISLGVRLNRERMFLLLLAVALAAGCVAFTGNLAFIGLLAPHLAKNLLPKETKSSFALAGISGGLLVLLADTLGRILLSSGEIPAGIVITFIGAPYFLFLLLRKKTQI